jgi:putative tryptophan/tyrosine transport system substrate-binding protein
MNHRLSVTRRNVFASFGIIAVWPLWSRKEVRPLPVVGVLGMTTRESNPNLLAFIDGMREGGYVAGRNVTIEYQMAEGRLGRLPSLTADFVRRQVAVIATNGGSLTALAAKAATSDIPIVFTTGDDPVGIGLVQSLSNPGGNITGVTVSSTELVPKRIALLREMMPMAETLALLLPQDTRANQRANQEAISSARNADYKVITLFIGIDSDLEPQFASARSQSADVLMVAGTPIFTSRRAEITALAARYALPAIYPFREFCESGGLMSYSPNLSVAYRQAGAYTARVLNGAAPRNLPVQLPERFELVVNLKTAKTLGIQIPRLVNARVDSVVE